MCLFSRYSAQELATAGSLHYIIFWMMIWLYGLLGYNYQARRKIGAENE